MRRLKAPQRRQQLIDVATKLFAKDGYDATTTNAIAQAAGISEPILYRHFKDKKDLFIAITREVSQKTLDHWQELIGGIEDPAEQLRTIAKEFPSHVRHLSDAYRVLHNGLTTSHDRRVVAVLREHYAQIEKYFVRIIMAGQRSGAFRNINPRTAIGIDEKGTKLFILVVDGRSDKSRGMTYGQLSKAMVDLGCFTAINLDGGGSSTIVMRDPETKELKILNHPSDRRERPVANVLGVRLHATTQPSR